MLDLKVDQLPGAIVLCPNIGRLDATAAPAFRLAMVARAAGHALVVIDMNTIRFVDSTGLGSLVSIFKVLPPGGHLRLALVADEVTVLLRVTGLNRIFPSFPTVAAALAA